MHSDSKRKYCDKDYEDEKREFVWKEERDYGKYGRFRRFYCRSCDVQLHDRDSFEVHLNGYKHIKTEQRSKEIKVRIDLDDGGRTGMEDTETPSQFRDRVFAFYRNQRNEQQYSSSRSRSPPGSKSHPRFPALPEGVQKVHGVGYKCSQCNKTAKTLDVMQNHLSSREHRKRVNPVEEFRCDICAVVVSSSETLRHHYNGVVHLKALKLHEQNQRKKDEYSTYSRRENEDQQREVQDLKKRCAELEIMVKNLQQDNKKLIRFKEHCLQIHHKTKRTNDSIAE